MRRNTVKEIRRTLHRIGAEQERQRLRSMAPPHPYRKPPPGLEPDLIRDALAQLTDWFRNMSASVSAFSVSALNLAEGMSAAMRSVSEANLTSFGPPRTRLADATVEVKVDTEAAERSLQALQELFPEPERSVSLPPFQDYTYTIHPAGSAPEPSETAIRLTWPAEDVPDVTYVDLRPPDKR